MKRLPVWRRPYGARRLLDIGGGHNPFAGVTHVLERDPWGGRERGYNRLLIPATARLVVGDAERLPFETAAFDFVYASHVLEHVMLPRTASAEIMRVGRAGYIETPSPFLEQGLSLTSSEPPESWFHRWFVFTTPDRVLVFEPKTPETIREFCSCSDGAFMREFFQAVDFSEAQHCFRRAAKTTMLYWKRSFAVEVRPGTLDCRKDERPCRFSGMRAVLLASCNDLVRSTRALRLRRRFPRSVDVFRKYGHRTLFVR